ncbi:monovalent cation/H+ antiporter complex subunit F [sulfur-oxidizing endosymbiont of Gigantopelta aegis]|uniref:monovalent cation/H+ antiporter complex subunit F n=1 Tax=sulfur-oxidizing endosymbiont of Gigantopelta aegis TaxID=2794934 RepID=UPI0018DE7AF5|nr:monovalent cation/H+ antiporter complex subunit F [sulfur-oxidizing endosymbiont of Gigantopelta aegis]
MSILYIGLSIFLFMTLIAGFWRVLKGPDEVDRMLAGQLFGTTIVACLLLLAQAFKRPDLQDVALVLALISAITMIAFVRLRSASDNKTGSD